MKLPLTRRRTSRSTRRPHRPFRPGWEDAGQVRRLESRISAAGFTRNANFLGIFAVINDQSVFQTPPPAPTPAVTAPFKSQSGIAQDNAEGTEQGDFGNGSSFIATTSASQTLDDKGGLGVLPSSFTLTASITAHQVSSGFGLIPPFGGPDAQLGGIINYNIDATPGQQAQTPVTITEVLSISYTPGTNNGAAFLTMTFASTGINAGIVPGTNDLRVISTDAFGNPVQQDFPNFVMAGGSFTVTSYSQGVAYAAAWGINLQTGAFMTWGPSNDMDSFNMSLTVTV